MHTISRIVLGLAVTLSAFAQAATRNVVLNWTPPTTGAPSGGYTLTRATGNAPPQALATAITGLTFTDTGAVIGATYTYALTANGPSCPVLTPTSPASTTPCGSSPTLSIIITVPAGNASASSFTAQSP